VRRGGPSRLWLVVKQKCTDGPGTVLDGVVGLPNA
jgi:hypothetical protein